MSEYKLLLRELRQAHQLSQEALAKELGISRQSIISLERGEYLPSFTLLISIIDFFDTDINNIIDLEQPQSKTRHLPETSMLPIENVAGSSINGLVNIFDLDDRYIIEIPAINIDEKDIEIEANEDSINISCDPKVANYEGNLVHSEWELAGFKKHIGLDSLIDPSSTKAKLKNGLLTLIVAKKHKDQKTHKIKINLS